MTNKRQGRVYLVGAGPGRADLITVRGAEVIKAADCLICDRLANPALLKFARQGAEIIHTPKRVGSSSFTQQKINELLIEKALAGKTVVRLKGGDPCIFGRCTEEAVALGETGIDFEIVPGVTAGLAAAGYTGIMLTDRKYSSEIIFVTGREADEKQKTNIDWRLLAKFGGTIVFYMGMGSLEYIVEQLMTNGLEKDKPTAVIADVSLPSQRFVKASVELISEKCRSEKISPPAIVVIGTAAESDPRLNWFMKKPLFGENIVVTRDSRGNAEFVAKIIEQGANAIEFPTIKIKPLTQMNKFLQALAKLAKYNWIIFTSVNGVRIFFECLRSLGKDARVFGSAKVAAIGSRTAAKLAEFGIRADFVPSVFTSKGLARGLVGFTNLRGKKILLLRSEAASDELIRLLDKAETEVDQIDVYTIVAEKGQAERLAERIGSGEIDWLTFASPSSAKAFFEQISAEVVNSSNAKVASIGPVTSEELKSLGIGVDVTATEHTIDGLLETIIRKQSI